MPPKDLYQFLEYCIVLKKEFPNLIAGELSWVYIILVSYVRFSGYDLVGYENQLHKIIEYIEPLVHFRKRQAEEGVEIPFLFHAGETLGDGDAADDNVYDAILLGTKRIGHG